jgi:hypothetical protein
MALERNPSLIQTLSWESLIPNGAIHSEQVLSRFLVAATVYAAIPYAAASADAKSFSLFFISLST